jgi:hypothetical protein
VEEREREREREREKRREFQLEVWNSKTKRQKSNRFILQLLPHTTQRPPSLAHRGLLAGHLNQN